jgi:hypothetical protein
MDQGAEVKVQQPLVLLLQLALPLLASPIIFVLVRFHYASSVADKERTFSAGTLPLNYQVNCR